MPKPTLCRAHLRMRRHYHRLNILRAVLAAYGATGIAVSAVLYFNGAPPWVAPILSFTGALAFLAGVPLTGAAERRHRWYRTGTAQCGSCRAVREGRRTPDGKPITPKASPR